MKTFASSYHGLTNRRQFSHIEFNIPQTDTCQLSGNNELVNISNSKWVSEQPEGLMKTSWWEDWGGGLLRTGGPGRTDRQTDGGPDEGRLWVENKWRAMGREVGVELQEMALNSRMMVERQGQASGCQPSGSFSPVAPPLQSSLYIGQRVGLGSSSIPGGLILPLFF